MSTTTESATTEATTKEGVEIKGKDLIKLNAPLILPPAGQLKTQAQDIVGAINELVFTAGTGAHNGSLRAVLDNETGEIKIVVGEIPEGETVTTTDETTDEETPKEQYTDYEYDYTAVVYTEEIKTESTVGDTTTTTTETFEQRIITELYNANGDLIMYCDYDEDTGEILGFYDGDDIPIYITEWR